MTSVVKGLMISAPKKSSGKTTLTLGLTSALTGQGRNVRVFKKGPDYIDPMWHKAASGHTCHNIDPYWMDTPQCRDIFHAHSAGMDLCLVEGNHGLHDGLDLEGNNSGAFLAKILEIPVLLVMDGSGMNRGAAAIILGHQLLDKDVTIAGVVLNNVASSRQAAKQRAAIEHYCGIPVVGALPRAAEAGIKERHLGLVTVHENPEVEQVIATLGKSVLENCDLETIFELAGEIEHSVSKPDSKEFPDPLVKIGVAYDKSFCFYYPENLDALRMAGAELVLFDTLKDSHLPEFDGIYIGGGFPESFLHELEENSSLREQLYQRIEKGTPVYAECGGLMYLTRSIERAGVKKQMVGAIPADVLFQAKPVGKGYSELSSRNSQSWFKVNQPIKGHEFHYSRLINLDAGIDFNFNVIRGTGVDGQKDGVIYKNVIASYTHIHASVVPQWADSFVSFVASHK
jgi:cobyrinic acid a,c-diamide synthase